MIANRQAEPGAKQEAIDMMLAHHVDDPAMATVTRAVAAQMVRYGTDGPLHSLRAVVERTKNREVRARAIADLAGFLRDRAEIGIQNTWLMVQLRREDPKGPYPAMGPLFNEKTFEAMTREARACYERVIAEFADVGQLADRAREDLETMARFGIGKLAPEIAGEDVDGKPMRLGEFRGKVVLLVFWGDWCPPCRFEYDAERDAFLAAAGRPFALLGVNSDPDRAAVKGLIASKGLPGRSWWDGGGTHGPIATQWKVKGWPTIYVLDAQARIRFKGVRGPRMRQAVEALLAEGTGAK